MNDRMGEVMKMYHAMNRTNIDKKEGKQSNKNENL